MVDEDGFAAGGPARVDVGPSFAWHPIVYCINTMFSSGHQQHPRLGRRIWTAMATGMKAVPNLVDQEIRASLAMHRLDGCEGVISLKIQAG